MRNLICGFGRCGSSLVMQMIDAAGGSVVGNHPMFETAQRKICIEDGFSVKILEPLTKEISDGEYRIVWLDRNLKEQAKSEIKFLDALGFPLPSVDQIANLHRGERDQALKRLSAYGRILILAFEDLITDCKAVERLATFLGLSDVEKMRRQIIPRSVGCLPDLKIEMTLAESGPKS